MKAKENTVASPTQADYNAPPVNPVEGDKKPLSHGMVPWGPWMSVIFTLLVYYVSQYAALLPLIAYPFIRGWNGTRADNWLSNSVVSQFFYVLFAEGLMFLAVWWFIRRHKSSLRDIGWQKYRWRYLLAIVVAYVVYALCYGALLSIATHVFPTINVNQKQQLGFQNVSGDNNLVLTFLSLVVIPPIVEETVFRGFVFTGLRNKLRWVWAALFTSLLFGTAHLELGNGQPPLWVAGLDTFTLSMVLCYLRQKTDSLWPGIFLHALKNGVAFVSLFILHVT